MERKLVKQGRNALTVTLPAKWLKQKGLKGGDDVYLDLTPTEIIIKSRKTALSKETSIDLRGSERSMIGHVLISKYINGYDKIELLHDNPTYVQNFTQRMLGMILEEHTNTRSIIKSLIVSPENNIDPIVRRMGHMLLQQAVLVLEVAKGNKTFEDVKTQERLLDANIYYCLRFINKYNLQQESYKHFLLCATIESAADALASVAKFIKNDVALGKVLLNGVDSYNKYLFTGDLKKLYTELRKFREGIPKKTFADGLAFQFAEILYNNLGYLMDKE